MDMLLNNKITRFLFTSLMPFIMVVYYFIMMGVNFNAILLLIYSVLSIIAMVICVKNAGNKFIQSMNWFLFYCLFTVVFYIFNGLPISCYYDTLRSFFFPLIFAYLGFKFSSDYSFNRWFLISCAFCFLVGFYLYTAIPSYYVQFLADARMNTWYVNDSGIDERNIMEMARFSSFFTTSYAISYLSISALIISLSFSLKPNIGINKGWCYFIGILSFIAALLCQQRIAMVYAVFVLIFFVVYSSKLSRTKNLLGLILIIIFLAILSGYLVGRMANVDWFVRISDLIQMRLDDLSFSKAMSERTDQYSSFNRATDFSYIFGLGLGSCGHAAGAAGFQSVNDGEYVKMFYEFGIVGCVLLTSVILPTLIRGIKFFKLYYAEVLIILFYLTSAIAANALTFFIFSIMFWYSLGRIWNKGYFEILKQER